MKKTLYTITAAFGLLMSQAGATVTLGADQACDFDVADTSIQALIDAHESEILITNQQAYVENLTINSSVTIKGGFDNCSDAANNTPSNQKSTIDGNHAGSVINISTVDSSLSVVLHSLVITNGRTDSFTEGGGITIKDPSLNNIILQTHDVFISNNESRNGGGVYISGADSGSGTSWTALKTNIINNNASNNGGGVYCNNSKLYLYTDSAISLNRASNGVNSSGKGGGLYATNRCEFTLQSGTEGGVLDFRGIQNNTATSHGGGIYASSGSVVELMHGKVPNNISNNKADSNNNGYGNGGGVYLEGAKLYARGALIKNNEAANGAGLSVSRLALARFSFYIDRFNGRHCWNFKKCNQITENVTTGANGKGGAFHLNEGRVVLGHTIVSYNSALMGAALYLENEADAYVVNSTLFKNGIEDEQSSGSESVYHLKDSYLSFMHTTSAYNEALSATIRSINGSVVIINSIVYEPITNLLANAITSTVEVSCSIFDNEFGITGSDYLIQNPMFVSSAQGDFHLRAESPAIDLCGYQVRNTSSGTNKNMLGFNVDIDGEPAPWDDPTVINGTLNGAFDAGSDETYINDVIFKNNFVN